VDFTFDAISAAERAHAEAVYTPFTQAIRELIDAAVRTGVDGQTIAQAQHAVEAVTATLTVTEQAGTRTLRDAVTGRPIAWGNPVVGARNAIAPPLDIQFTDGECWAEFDLGSAYEGPPGWVHGGMCALVLDHILGEAASDQLSKPFFTGTLTCKYLRGTPLGRLRAVASLERVDGVKAYAHGHISDADGVTVQADGVFIMPAWARGQP